MGIIQLQHDPRLSYATKKDLPPLSEHALQLAKAETVITFRDGEKTKPTRIYNNFNGCSRFLNVPAGDLIFCGLESDSPLASIILWDAAHRLMIGDDITLLDDFSEHAYLERDYFKKSFSLIQKDAQQKVFRKIAPLLAEEMLV